MTSADLLVDGFGRILEAVHEATDGLTPDQLAYRVEPGANSIAWLVWHLARVQDHHVSELIGVDQVWTAQGWYERFDLPFGKHATGYGQRPKDVEALRGTSAELLTAYYDAVHDQTIEYVATLTDEDLPRVVDDSWDPPVTLGVRLISVIDDDLRHAGQAGFVRGVVERTS